VILLLKKVFITDLRQSGSADIEFDCDILSRKALGPCQQQLMAEAPAGAGSFSCEVELGEDDQRAIAAA
jgi:hypothetical protein